MKWLWLLLPLAASCRPGGSSTCCEFASVVQRDVPYESALPAVDGGAQTQVKLLITRTGSARLTFVREGQEVVEVFEVVP